MSKRSRYLAADESARLAGPVYGQHEDARERKALDFANALVQARADLHRFLMIFTRLHRGTSRRLGHREVLSDSLPWATQLLQMLVAGSRQS